MIQLYIYVCIYTYIYTHTYFLLFFTAEKEGKICIWIYFGHLMPGADSLEKTLMLGKIEGRRRRGRQRMKWLDSITASMDMKLNKPQETVKDSGAWRAAVHGVVKIQKQLSDLTTSS